MIFNTHTHLNSKELYDIHEELIKNASECNVKKLVVVGFDLESSKKAIEIAEKHENIYASVGICPTEIRSESLIDYDEYEKLLKSKKVVDFYKFEKLLNIIDMEMIYGTEILLSGKNRKRVQQPH